MPEARAFLNLKLQNYHRLKSDLALTGHSLEKFDVLNSHIANTVVRSGELIIIGDPTTASCTSQEAWMMRQAAIAHMKLDEQLNKLAAYGSGIRNKGSIKRTLGISTKSYLHTGEIAGYANKVSGVATAANLIKKGTYVGIALDVAATGLEIHKACTLGREEECKKAHYVEVSSLTLGLLGTTAGAASGKLLLGAACSVVFGVATGGTGALACGIFGGTAGGMAGGKFGNEAGAWAGELLYEAVAK